MSLASHDPAELHRGIRELVALSTLPVAWRGTPTAAIPDSLADVLLRSLGAECILFRVSASVAGNEIGAVRLAAGPTVPERAAEVRRALLSCIDLDDEALPSSIPDPLHADGSVRIAVHRIGPGGEDGVLVAASRRPDFPTAMDRVLLEVGGNEAATVLQQRHAEERLHGALAEAERATRLKDEFITTVSNDLRWMAAIVHSSNDAIVGKTLEGMVTSWNPGAEQLYGYSAHDMIGRHIRITAPPERADEATEILERIKRGERVHRYDTQRVTKAGRLIDVSLTVSGIRDTSGALIGASVIARDISERARAEKRLRALLEAAPDATVIVDSSGRILMVNAQVEPLLGYQRHELLGQHVETLVPHHARRQHATHRLDYARAARPRPMGAGLDLTAVRKDGKEVAVEISLSPIETDEGTLVVAAIRDVTERKAADAEREQLASIVDYSDDAIIGKTLDGIIVTWNKGAERLYGYSSEEVLGRPISILLPPNRPDQLPGILTRLARGEHIEHQETVRRRKDGTLVDVSLIISPVKNSLGHVIGASTVARDITDRRRAERALREAEAKLAHVSRVATMGELASSIAHEVNQPLAAIVNDGAACLRWLQGHPPALDEARDSVQHIIGDANRASHVIARIRALLARKPSAKSPFDPNELVSDTVALVKGELARVGATLGMELAAGLPSVMGDRIQVQQVLLNLLMNALEAVSRINGRPRELTVVSARGASSTVVIAVRDSGDGIMSDLRDRIFEPFYTTKPEGLGMGLAISRSIIEEHGGQLWALEPTGAVGATVQFTIPVADEDA